MMNGIEVKNVCKRFGSVTALEDVTLTFEPKKIYGLLGRNGAGKSTLLNIITNRIFADSGQVLVDGAPARENDAALQKIYLMSEKNYYPEKMKVREALEWSQTFYPEFDMSYARELSERFGLDLKKQVRGLSTGYQSIFKVITALSVNTPYVLLDEPVLGLDANHRDLFYKILLEKYADSPSTLVISTHLIEEVSAVIEDIMIIKNGRLIRNESCETFLSKGYTVTGSISAVDLFTAGREMIGSDTMGGLKTAYIIGTPPDKQVMPEGLEITKMDLQKLFIQLTNI